MTTFFLHFTILYAVLLVTRARSLVTVPGSVTGVVGFPISVPCDLTPPSPGDSPHLILWYKNIFGTPIYSVDMRNGVEAASHWRDRSVFGDRVKFLIHSTNISISSELRFETTLPQDAGPYRCRVDFWKAATRNYKIYLQLVEQADTVRIYDSSGSEVTEGMIVSRINSTLVLTCKSSGGRPLPTISWQSSGHRPLQGNQTVSVGSEVTSVLMMTGLQQRDANTVISCIAHNNQMQVPPSASVTLDIVLAPVRVEISRTVSSFVSGQSYNVTCQVLGSNPPPDTTLWIGGKPLEIVRKSESSDGKIFTTVANFEPTPTHDASFISCRAYNQYVPEETLEDQWKISVLFRPVTNLTFHSKQNSSSLTVSEGKRVVLRCGAHSNPPPFNYHWRQNGFTRVIRHTGLPSELILNSVSRVDSGNYTCVAENSHGLGESNMVTLNVQFVPTCLRSQPQLITISVHESIDLECGMTSRPGNVSFSWKMALSDAAEVYEVATSQFTAHAAKSVFTFTPRTPADFGRVTCTGANLLGEGAPCVFQITRRLQLPGVHDCSLTNKENSLAVICEERGTSFSPIVQGSTQFLADLQDLKLGLSTQLSSSRPTFQFSSVRPGATFNLSIYSVDVKSPTERRLVFTKIIKTVADSDRVILGELGDKSSQDEEGKEFDRMIPMIIIFSCLTTVLVFVMIIITLVKRSSEYSKGSGLQTHVAFNKNLDKDIDHEPDILHNTKGAVMGSPPDPSMHKVYSLDQLNQVSFEGFTSLNPNIASSKYNTLPSRQIAIIEQIYNNREEQAPLMPTPKSILVKKVTFEKPASSSSSATSTPTLDMSSFNEGSGVAHYLDMGNIGGNPPSYDGYHTAKYDK